jgi:hypothetical protein
VLLTGVTFQEIVLAVHILAVVGALGIVVGYPLIMLTAERLDRRSLPLLHRVRVVIGRTLVNPGLLVVVVAGVYLASDGHEWSHFYVQWGLAAALVIGGLEGAVVIRQEKRLAELAARDVGAAGGGARAGEVEWSGDDARMRRRADRVASGMALLVAITVVVMTVQ